MFWVLQHPRIVVQEEVVFEDCHHTLMRVYLVEDCHSGLLVRKRHSLVVAASNLMVLLKVFLVLRVIHGRARCVGSRQEEVGWVSAPD
jgi:hypothetical protein